MHKAWCSIEEVPYNFLWPSINFQDHTGWKIDYLNPVWVRLLGRSQLSNPSDLPLFLLQFLSSSLDHRSITSKFVTRTAPSCIDNSWRSTTLPAADSASSNQTPFWKFWNIKHSFNLTSDMKRSSKIMPRKVFSWWWRHRWRHRVASKSALYIPL